MTTPQTNMDPSLLNLQILAEAALACEKMPTRHPLPNQRMKCSPEAVVSKATSSTAITNPYPEMGDTNQVEFAMGATTQDATPENATFENAAAEDAATEDTATRSTPATAPAAAPVPAPTPLPAIAPAVTHHPVATPVNNSISGNYGAASDRGMITELYNANKDIVDEMKNIEKYYAYPGKQPCSSKYPGDKRAAKRGPPTSWMCYLILSIVPGGCAPLSTIVAMINELYPQAQYNPQTVRAALSRAPEFVNLKVNGPWALLTAGVTPPKKQPGPGHPRIKPNTDGDNEDFAAPRRRSRRKHKGKLQTLQDDDEEPSEDIDEEYDDEPNENEERATKRQKTRSGRVIKKTVKASSPSQRVSRNKRQGKAKAFQVVTDDEDEESAASTAEPCLKHGKAVSRVRSGSNISTGTWLRRIIQEGSWTPMIGNGPWTLPEPFTEKWIPLKIMSPPARTSTSTHFTTSGQPKNSTPAQSQTAPKPIGVEVLGGMRVSCCPSMVVKLRLYRPEDHAIDISAVCCPNCMVNIALHIETRCAVLGFRDLMPGGYFHVLDNYNIDWEEDDPLLEDEYVEGWANHEPIQLTRVGNKFIWARLTQADAVSASMKTYAKTWNMRWSRTRRDWVKIGS